MAPFARATPEARWSVAPSASGSEYGRPTSRRSAPASTAASAAARLVSASGIARDDVRDQGGSARRRVPVRTPPRSDERRQCRSFASPWRSRPRQATSANRSSAAMSLSPRPEKPRRTRVSSGQTGPPGSHRRPRCRPAAWAARRPRARSRAQAGSPRRGSPSHRGDGLAIGRRRDLEPACRDESGELGPDPRIVETGRRRVRLDDLPVAVLEHERARCRGGSPASRRRSGRPRGGRLAIPSPAASATARRTEGSPMNRASSPIAFEPPPTQASARSGQSAFDRRAAGRPPRRRSGRWRSRTIVGYGCGPIADPRT